VAMPVLNINVGISHGSIFALTLYKSGSQPFSIHVTAVHENPTLCRTNTKINNFNCTLFLEKKCEYFKKNIKRRKIRDHL